MTADDVALPGWLGAFALVAATLLHPTTPPPQPAAPAPHAVPGACRELRDDRGPDSFLADGIPDETVTWTYDVLGRPIRRVDAAGAVTLLYDAAGRLARELYPENGRIEHDRDPAGHEIATRYYVHGGDVPDFVTTRTFDRTGQLLEMLENADANGANGRVHRYSYERGELVRERVDGRETTYRYDDAGRLLFEIDELGTSWYHHYDETGHLVEKLLLSPYGRRPLVRITYLYDCWH